MENLFRSGRNELVKEAKVDRVRLSASPYSYEENRGIYQALKDKKEPIKIVKNDNAMMQSRLNVPEQKK